MRSRIDRILLPLDCLHLNHHIAALYDRRCLRRRLRTLLRGHDKRLRYRRLRKFLRLRKLCHDAVLRCRTKLRKCAALLPCPAVIDRIYLSVLRRYRNRGIGIAFYGRCRRLCLRRLFSPSCRDRQIFLRHLCRCRRIPAIKNVPGLCRILRSFHRFPICFC